LLRSLTKRLTFLRAIYPVKPAPLTSPIVKDGDGVPISDTDHLASELNGWESRRNGGITFLTRRQHLGSRRKGSPSELAFVAMIAALFAVVMAAIGIESSAIGSRRVWSEDRDQEGEEK